MTLNNLKERLIGFFNSHAIINDVLYESDFDFNAERELKYPCVNIEYLQPVISGKLTTRTWKITLADLESEDNYDEVISDMEQIAEDFFTWAQYQDDFQFNKAVSMQTFSNDMGDRTAGLVFNVNLTVTRPQNECATPVKQSTPSNQTTVYFGTVDDLNALNNETAIEAGTPMQIKKGWNVVLSNLDDSNPTHYFMAEPIGEPAKRSWYVSASDKGGIGVDASNLFGIPRIIGRYRVYMTSYKTQLTHVTLKKDYP